MKSFVRLMIGLLPLAVLFVGCQSGGPQFFSNAYLANQAAAQFDQMKTEVPVSRDAVESARLQRVGERIAALVQNEVEPANWEFVLFDSPDINAFAMPGGKIGFFKGIMELASTDDELATVMAHEVAHVLEGHSNQQMSAQLIGTAGAIITEVVAQNQEVVDPEAVRGVYGISTTLGLLGYSRHHEYEADEVGLLLMARAGYDPRAAISFWEKMQAAASGARPPEFFSTHPASGNRIQRLEEMMPQALALYEQNRQ